MQKVYNTFTKSTCFIKEFTNEDGSNDLKYHCVDEKGNTIWNGQYLWFPQSAIKEIA